MAAELSQKERPIRRRHSPGAFGLISRVLQAAVLLLAVIVLNFLLIHLAPGDAATVVAGASGGVTEEQLARIRAEYNLDQPFAVQLLTYIGRLLQGDLGTSLYFGESVAGLIGERLGPTLLLAGTGMFVGLLVGTSMGVIAAVRPSSFVSYLVTILALVGFAAPVFWTGVLLVLAFSIILPIFPSQGMSSIIVPDGMVAQVVDIAAHLVLPATALGLIYVALYSRTTRASMQEALGSDYTRTAWAKGLKPTRVIVRHALRNALMPVVTLFGMQVGALLSSVVLVEVVFNWPGLGSLLLQSIERRDIPVILGILLASSLVVIVANLLTDIAYRFVDPRISVGGVKR